MNGFTFSFSAMGLSYELKFYAQSESIARELAELAIHSIRVLEQRYSGYLKNNVLNEINQAAKAGASIRVDEETAAFKKQQHDQLC